MEPVINETNIQVEKKRKSAKLKKKIFLKTNEIRVIEP